MYGNVVPLTTVNTAQVLPGTVLQTTGNILPTTTVGNNDLVIIQDTTNQAELINQLQNHINENQQILIITDDQGQDQYIIIDKDQDINALLQDGKLNNLTTGQLQRKVRYAMSQLKHIDEHSYLRNNFKTTKSNHTNINSRKQNECNGTMDMAVTVRQIDKRHNRQSIRSPDHIWKPYIDRLFDQGHSADEIQRLLHEAAETTMQCDDYRLQDVFSYINTKVKQSKAKTAPSKIAFVVPSTKTKPVSPAPFQSTNLFQSIKSNEKTSSNSRIMTCPSTSISASKVMSNELSSAFNTKDQRSTIEGRRNKSSSSSASLNISLIKSSSIEPDIIQIKSMENKFINDLSTNEKEQNLSLHSFVDQEHVNIMVNSSPTTTINKHQSIANIETIIENEKNNDNNSESDNIIIITEQKPNQSQEVIDSMTLQTNKTSSFHNLQSKENNKNSLLKTSTNNTKKNKKTFNSIGSSTTKITSSNNSIDMPLTNLEEQSIHELQRVHNVLDTIDHTDLHLHSLNSPLELNKLIDIIFESNLHKPDSMEILMTKCIELLNNEKLTIASQLEEIHFQNSNKEIFNTLNLLQEYQRLILPFIINNEDSLYNRHISNMIMISSDSQTSLKSINENIEPTIESSSQIIQSNIDLNLKQQINISEYQETAGPIRCRPIPYTVSNEKRSTESLRQEFLCSPKYISLTIKELNEQLITSKNDLNDTSNILLKIDDELYDDQSQKQWLDSLLSKISNNISRTSNISLTSSSLLVTDQTKIDDKHKNEFIIMEQIDEQVLSLNEGSKSSISIHEHTTNMIETTDDKHNTQYVTDVIILKKAYAMSIIIPDQIFSMIEEQFQVAETKLLQKNVAISSTQILKLNDQLISLPDEKNIKHVNRELSNLNYDFNDTFQKSSSVTTLHANHVDEEKKSISSVVNDETPSIIDRSSTSSDMDLSEQLNQLQIREDTVSLKQLLSTNVLKSNEKFESPQELYDNENEDKISPVFVSEHIALSKTDIDYVPETNTDSSLSNDQEEEEVKTKSVLSFSSDNHEDVSLIETNEPHIDIEKPSKSSHANAQLFNEHTSITTSTVFNHQNEINKLQLPVSTQYFNISNDIKSNSFLTDLNNQNSIVSYKESISNNVLKSNEEKKHSPTNSHNQNIVKDISIQNIENKKLSNDKIDNAITNEFHKSTILLVDHNITQQSVKSVLSPSKTTVNIY
ncbi:unnamed protein product [Rotaria sp. Silwood2]|nr:unnamed protein product [Rotaria sp. Silwood2]